MGFAEELDAAGLGPADYLYVPLKKRLRNLEKQAKPVGSLLSTTAMKILTEPPIVSGALRPAPILFAGSYVNAIPLLKRVASKFDEAEWAFCSTLDSGREAGVEDRLQVLLAMPSAVYFATKVRAKARLLEAEGFEIGNIVQAAFIHRLYRGLARSILRKCRTKCLVIGNANRPFELALWAEATGLGLKTVLLPYQEMEMHPARMFSLCRGRFSSFLPFSEYSATKIRQLNPDAQVEAAGFPPSLSTDELTAVASRPRKGRRVLYIAGSNETERDAADLLRRAFGTGNHIDLRVRLHPSGNTKWFRSLFEWLGPAQISDPSTSSLSGDLVGADVMITIGSTVSFDAMTAGIPVVWLTPPSVRQEIAHHPIRNQQLALLDALGEADLGEIVTRLFDDSAHYETVVKDQWQRIASAGLNKPYFTIVKSAIEELIA